MTSYGVKTSRIRKIAKKYFKLFKTKGTNRDCLESVEELMSTKVFENQLAGIFLLNLFLRSSGEVSISKIRGLIARYIDNWATCDTISSEVVARRIVESPERAKVLYSWINSTNIWLKRAALVTVIKLKDGSKNWQELAFRILVSSRKEKEPILKKAVRWLERELL